MNDEQVPALRQAVESMRSMRENYDQFVEQNAQLVEQNAQLAADVQAIKNAHILGFSYDGIIFEEGYEPQSAFGIIANRSKILEIHDDRDTVVPAMAASDYPLLVVLEMRNANSITYNQNGYPLIMAESQSIRKIIIPEVVSIGTVSYGTKAFARNCTNLIEVNILNNDFLTQTGFNDKAFAGSPNLIDIITGKRFGGSATFLNYWSPTNAMLDDSTSLLTQEDIAAGFESNRKKLLYNIREHIAANLPDRTDLSPFTITFSQTLRDAFDQATDDAFAAKNWDIAPARS